MATYVAELKALARHCKFGPSLNEMIRDRLVCGVNDNHIQRTLLQEPELTYEKALEIAQGIEAASQDVQKLQQQQQSLQLFQQKPQFKPACWQHILGANSNSSHLVIDVVETIISLPANSGMPFVEVVERKDTFPEFARVNHIFTGPNM